MQFVPIRRSTTVRLRATPRATQVELEVYHGVSIIVCDGAASSVAEGIEECSALLEKNPQVRPSRRKGGKGSRETRPATRAHYSQAPWAQSRAQAKGSSRGPYHAVSGPRTESDAAHWCEVDSHRRRCLRTGQALQGDAQGGRDRPAERGRWATAPLPPLAN